MHATIRARLESRPVATFSTDLFPPEVEGMSSALAAAGQDLAPALSQPPSPPRPHFESIGSELRYPEFSHPEASSAGRDAMCA